MFKAAVLGVIRLPQKGDESSGYSPSGCTLEYSWVGLPAHTYCVASNYMADSRTFRPEHPSEQPTVDDTCGSS